MPLTSKGQVTIPKEIRDHLGIGPGSEVGFVQRGGTVLLVSLDNKQSERRREEAILAWADRVAGTIDLGGMATDELIADLRGPRDELGPR